MTDEPHLRRCRILARSNKSASELLAATVLHTDAQIGDMKAEFIPDNTVGGVGDKLHPNRLGYHAMGMAIDLAVFAARGKGRRRWRSL